MRKLSTYEKKIFSKALTGLGELRNDPRFQGHFDMLGFAKENAPGIYVFSLISLGREHAEHANDICLHLLEDEEMKDHAYRLARAWNNTTIFEPYLPDTCIELADILQEHTPYIWSPNNKEYEKIRIFGVYTHAGERHSEDGHHTKRKNINKILELVGSEKVNQWRQWTPEFQRKIVSEITSHLNTETSHLIKESGQSAGYRHISLEDYMTGVIDTAAWEPVQRRGPARCADCNNLLKFPQDPPTPPLRHNYSGTCPKCGKKAKTKGQDEDTGKICLVETPKIRYTAMLSRDGRWVPRYYGNPCERCGRVTNNNLDLYFYTNDYFALNIEVHQSELPYGYGQQDPNVYITLRPPLSLTKQITVSLNYGYCDWCKENVSYTDDRLTPSDDKINFPTGLLRHRQVYTQKRNKRSARYWLGDPENDIDETVARPIKSVESISLLFDTDEIDKPEPINDFKHEDDEAPEKIEDYIPDDFIDFLSRQPFKRRRGQEKPILLELAEYCLRPSCPNCGGNEYVKDEIGRLVCITKGCYTFLENPAMEVVLRKTKIKEYGLVKEVTLNLSQIAEGLKHSRTTIYKKLNDLGIALWLFSEESYLRKQPEYPESKGLIPDPGFTFPYPERRIWNFPYDTITVLYETREERRLWALKELEIIPRSKEKDTRWMDVPWPHCKYGSQSVIKMTNGKYYCGEGHLAKKDSRD